MEGGMADMVKSRFEMVSEGVNDWLPDRQAGVSTDKRRLIFFFQQLIQLREFFFCFSLGSVG